MSCFDSSSFSNLVASLETKDEFSVDGIESKQVRDALTAANNRKSAALQEEIVGLFQLADEKKQHYIAQIRSCRKTVAHMKGELDKIDSALEKAKKGDMKSILWVVGVRDPRCQCD